MSAVTATILLIDDHGESRDILRAMLEWKGHRVLQCDNADRGVGMAAVERPAVIITEFLVPHRGGRCVIEDLRDNDATRAIPVVTFTTDGSAEARARVGHAGGIYVAKPMEPRLVCALIEQVLASPIAFHGQTWIEPASTRGKARARRTPPDPPSPAGGTALSSRAPDSSRSR